MENWHCAPSNRHFEETDGKKEGGEERQSLSIVGGRRDNRNSPKSFLKIPRLKQWLCGSELSLNLHPLGI